MSLITTSTKRTGISLLFLFFLFTGNFSFCLAQQNPKQYNGLTPAYSLASPPLPIDPQIVQDQDSMT